MRLAALATAVALAVAPMPADAAPSYQIVSAERGPGMPPTYYPHTAISGNGRFVAFHVQYNPASVADAPVPCCVDGVPRTSNEIWLADLATGKKVKVMTGDCCIKNLSLSRDGRYLVFESYEKTLVPKDKNERTDVFYYDSKTRRINRIVGVAGQELNLGASSGIVTADGSTIVYVSHSDVLNKRNQQTPPCSIYKYSLRTRKTVPVVVNGTPMCAFSGQMAASSDGRYLAISAMDSYVREDSAGEDVYWIDTVAKRVALVSETAAASDSGVNEQNDSPSIDGSGRFVAWVSGTTTPFSLRIDKTVMVREVKTGRLVEVSTGMATTAAQATEDPRLSEDGNWLTFLDNHGEVPGANYADFHAVYVRDLRKDISTTERIEPLGQCVDADCTHPISQNAVPSSNGKVIAYMTSAGMAQGDDDHALDVYVVRR